EATWYFAHEYWDAYFSMLARNRFNRFNLVFAHQTNDLAPPYPYLVTLPEFPQILVPGLSDAERARNLDALCYAAKAAADHGVDFAWGIGQQNTQPSQLPTVEGITSSPDFQVLASLARYHAHKQRAALNLEWFDVTGNPEALAGAK